MAAYGTAIGDDRVTRSRRPNWTICSPFRSAPDIRCLPLVIGAGVCHAVPGCMGYSPSAEYGQAGDWPRWTWRRWNPALRVGADRPRRADRKFAVFPRTSGHRRAVML